MLILKAVSLGGLHGYGVLLRLQQLTGRRLQIQQGSLYPALYRLEQRADILEWGEAKTSAKAKFYTLTASGRKQLKAETVLWNSFSTVVAGFQARFRVNHGSSGAANNSKARWTELRFHIECTSPILFAQVSTVRKPCTARALSSAPWKRRRTNAAKPGDFSVWTNFAPTSGLPSVRSGGTRALRRSQFSRWRSASALTRRSSACLMRCALLSARPGRWCSLSVAVGATAHLTCLTARIGPKASGMAAISLSYELTRNVVVNCAGCLGVRQFYETLGIRPYWPQARRFRRSNGRMGGPMRGSP